MEKRAAICIGVDRAGSMTPLQAAVQGARDFELWAKLQGCDTVLLKGDDAERVTIAKVFDEVENIVNAGTYSQLIVYFSGHGILTAPGAEYWLLSRAPQNPNEAVNIPRSIVDARNSGIPHVVFISDACRSSVPGPPLSGIVGSLIFPSRPFGAQGEVDVYYATRPGDPAYEVPEAESTRRYRGIFTDELLKVVKKPPVSLVETVSIGQGNASVISSRKMKNHLEATVPVEASDIDIKLRQAPQVIVETALPKYFAQIPPGNIVTSRGSAPSPVPPAPSIDRALYTLSQAHFVETQGVPPSQADTTLTETSGLLREFREIAGTRGRPHFETETGFTVFGVKGVDVEAQYWIPDQPFPATNQPGWHIRLNPPPGARPYKPSTIVFSFGGESGAALAILPGFIGTLIVENGRLRSVNYVPSDQTWRYKLYKERENQLDAMKAFAAVASRNGRFVVENENAAQLAYRIRQEKGIDPTMGVYAAYAYTQIGKFADVYSVYSYMLNEEYEIPIPFDVGLLATEFKPDLVQDRNARFAPFFPMLAQGWAYLSENHPMFDTIQGELRPHLIPSLWTTLSPKGAEIAANAVRSRSYR